jgi:hypothetical protein
VRLRGIGKTELRATAVRAAVGLRLSEIFSKAHLSTEEARLTRRKPVALWDPAVISPLLA